VTGVFFSGPMSRAILGATVGMAPQMWDVAHKNGLGTVQTLRYKLRRV